MPEKGRVGLTQSPNNLKSEPPRSLQARKRWYKKWWGVIIIFFIFIVASLLLIFIYQVIVYYGKVKTGEEVNKVWLTSEEKAEESIDESVLSAELQRKLIESSDDPFIGPKDAKVVVVEFSDFECPFCKSAYPGIKKMIREYKDSVRFIYRDFPLEGLHDNAFLAAQAAECADDQASFWRMHDKIFEHQEDLSYEKILEIADGLGLAKRNFTQCMDGNKYLREVEEDIKDGQMVGVKGTPTFFINGKKYVGALKFEDFKKIIDRELAK